jgi:hypothetical protein
MKLFRLFPATAAVVALVGAAAVVASAESGSAAGTLTLNASLRLTSDPGPCPTGDATLLCAARTQSGPVQGLGQVTGAYTWVASLGPPECAGSMGKVHGYPLRLRLGSTGSIDVILAAGAACVEQESVRSQTQAFTVTGGTGGYAGASGAGTIETILQAETATGRVGRATWKGTLSVPGLDFDTTAPTLSGGTNRTAKAKRRAKSARVTFQVTAQDDRDGSVPVTCTPKSGGRFPLGRTLVTCTATDSSANTATARFTITVKRTR